MDEQMKSHLTSSAVWVRGLYMIFFAIAWGLSEVLLVFSALFQLLAVLFTGSANLNLLRFGQNLSRYHYQIARFVTFNTEERPFPFSDWPNDEPDGGQWTASDDPADLNPAEETTATVSQPDDAGSATAEPAAESATDADADETVSGSRKDEGPPPA